MINRLRQPRAVRAEFSIAPSRVSSKIDEAILPGGTYPGTIPTLRAKMSANPSARGRVVPRPHITAATLGALQPGAQPQGYRTLVHVAGSGVLTAIGIADAQNYHYFKISIDGQRRPLVDSYLCATVGPRTNNGMSVIVPFDSELTVEVRDDGTLSPSTCYWAAWREQ